jgi:uncharacterized protein
MTGRGAGTLAVACLLGGCGVPVNVRTSKPLEVDVRMQVTISQRKVDEATDTQAAPPTSDDGTSDEEIRRRERMGQIQTFKNSRIVGENHRGLLTIIRLPPGEYGKQVEQAVAAENADRTVLMQVEAQRRKAPLSTIEAEEAADWRERAFPGEWVEERQPDGTWRFVQKQASAAPATLVPPASPTR